MEQNAKLLNTIMESKPGNYSLSQVIETTDTCIRLLYDIMKREEPINDSDNNVIGRCRESLLLVSQGDLIGCESLNVIELMGKASVSLMSQQVMFNCGDFNNKGKICDAISFLQELISQYKEKDEGKTVQVIEKP